MDDVERLSPPATVAPICERARDTRKYGTASVAPPLSVVVAFAAVAPRFRTRMSAVPEKSAENSRTPKLRLVPPFTLVAITLVRVALNG